MTRKIAILPWALLSVGGCQSTMYSATGDVMSAYTTDHVVPAMMANDDIDMACGTGLAFAPFIMSFGRVTDEPLEAGSVTMLSAGFCAEAMAWDAELSQLRALKEGRASTAQDARISEKRYHQLAAARFLASFELMQRAYGKVGEGCPTLEGHQELLFLLGLAAGVNAVVHDKGAQGAAGVPMDIPMAVARAASCLDSATWWGVPDALKGAIWASVPGAAPPGQDPWALLQSAAAKGDEAGVRLARGLLVQALAGAGKTEELRATIVHHARSLGERPQDPNWRMLDRMGTAMIQHESDKLWTLATGHRTPVDALGTFYEAPTPGTLNEDLLDDLEPPVQEPSKESTSTSQEQSS